MPWLFVWKLVAFITEDAAWSRKRNNFNHINVAELNAVLKGINLALRLGWVGLRLWVKING